MFGGATPLSETVVGVFGFADGYFVGLSGWFERGRTGVFGARGFDLLSGCSLASKSAARHKGDRMKSGTGREAEQQFQEIDAAQRRVRQGKSKQIIDLTTKSQQRADHRLRRTGNAEEAAADYDEGLDDLPDGE